MQNEYLLSLFVRTSVTAAGKMVVNIYSCPYIVQDSVFITVLYTSHQKI